MALTDNTLQHHQLGLVKITVRAGSRTISARWKNGIVHLNVPTCTSNDEINGILDKFTPALLKHRPSLRYHDGQQIAIDGANIIIGRQSLKPNAVIGQCSNLNATITVGHNLDFNSDEVTKSISNTLCKIAKHLAPIILLPLAEELSKKVGAKPSGWSISNGHRVLGHCNNHRHIALSYMVVFLPTHLREYIILHELAHLTEMNHSQRFHRLCDKYCNGNEARYIKELKSHQWQVLK